MKIHAILRAAVIAVAFTGSAFAQQEAEIKPASLLGKWKVSAKQANGAVMTTLVQFRHNLKFAVATTVGEAPFMEATGEWKVVGQTLEWHYEESSHPSIQKGSVDVDDIQSVTVDELTLKSRLSGRTQIYERVR